MVNRRMQQTDHLRDVAYKDTKNLNARIRFWQKYGEPRDEAFRKFWDKMTVPENASILDLGCGPANYWQWGLDNDRVASSWSMTLTDLSQGMIDDARKNVAARPDKFAFEIADVCDLQFADETFEVVTANYMLYHASDLDQAISEIARVLKPGGRLYAKTNSENHIVEFLDLQDKLIVDESERKNLGLAHAAFTLENGGAVIEKHFSGVEVQHDKSICKATDPEIAIDYAMSMDANLDPQRLRTTVEAEIRTAGYFKVTRSSGMFIAQK